MAAEPTGILQAFVDRRTARNRLPVTKLWLRSDSQVSLKQVGCQLGKLRALGIRVEVRHVKGHLGEPGNEAADWMAARKLTEELAVSNACKCNFAWSATQLEDLIPSPLIMLSMFVGIGAATLALSELGWTPARAFGSDILPG